MPPLPPQPPRPPDDTPPPGNGGFGPLPEGFGPPPEGYGTPSGGYGPPPGGYGPPPGGGGPPWQGGGDWQQPPPPGPPGGPGGRRNTLFIVLAVIVAIGAVAAVVLVVTSNDGSSGKQSPAESSDTTGSTPTPSLSIPSDLPSELPSLPSGVPDLPSDLPSGLPTDLESLLPTPAGNEVPYYMLKAGDCFNVDNSRPGQAAKRSCSTAHDAEVVKVTELTGTYSTDAALKKAATDLCEKPLQAKAVKQPAGTVRGTLVQYPDPTGFKLGIDNVACSLSADPGGNRKLTKPLT